MWERSKKKALVSGLENIEGEIKGLLRVVDEDFFTVDRKQTLRKLEAAHTKILLHKEETIRQKSRVV